MAEINEIIVSSEDIKKIEEAQERRYALRNLIYVCDENPLIKNEKLYEKFLKDYAREQKHTEELWDEIAIKYGFEIPDDKKVYLDFTSGKISFLESEKTIYEDK